MFLVDTSSWIHGLRPEGDPEARRRLERLLEGGEACWCPLVRLELWNGARGAHESRVLRDLEARLLDLEIDAQVWSLGIDLARRARAKGLTIPATDIVIAACARRHGVGLEHTDEHYDALEKLGD